MKKVRLLYEVLKGKYLTYHLSKHNDYLEHQFKKFARKDILGIDQTSEIIKNLILSGKPFMVCRFGANELSTLKTFDFEISSKYQKQLQIAHVNAGLFPETVEIGKEFSSLMIKSIPEADIAGIWPSPFEEYYYKRYGNENLEYTWLKNLEPWRNIKNPWSSALKGKKVLVIHPFKNSILNQYKKREEIYPNTNILPEFDLKVLKSIQTSGGENDDRFKNWFDAYKWMLNEIKKIDFEIAILGCGAYGYPLAAEIKKMGKQAIHFGGGTQLLFGIIGARWDNDKAILSFVNDSWVRPLDSEKPKDSQSVEKGCYW